jgi:hypothetical protein
MLTPQIIPLYFVFKLEPSGVPCWDLLHLRTIAPVVLHVCRESRDVALSHYTLGFELEKKNDEAQATRSPRTCHLVTDLVKRGTRLYWSAETDMVFLTEIPWDSVDDFQHVLQECGRTSICWQRKRGQPLRLDHRLKTLAMSESSWTTSERSNTPWTTVLPALETMVVVVDRKMWFHEARPSGICYFDNAWLAADKGDQESDAKWEAMKRERDAFLQAQLQKDWDLQRQQAIQETGTTNLPKHPGFKIRLVDILDHLK